VISRSAALVGASAIFLTVVGVALRNSYLVVGSVPLLLFLVLGHLAEGRPHLDVKVQQSFPDESIYEGGTAELRVKVRNLGPDIDIIEVFDDIPEELTLESGTNHFIGSLRSGQYVEFGFVVRPRVFGVHRVGPIRVRTLDTLGLFVEEKVVDSYSDLKVYPEVQYVRQLHIKPRNARNWPGEILTRKSGTGAEFYGLRSYSPSDSFKRINWKASSRSEELVSNQFMSEFGGDTIIALDLRSASVLGSPPDSTATYATRAAAVVAYRLLRDRNRVGMIALGNRLDKVRPGFGRRQFDRLLTSMVEIKPGDAWEIGNLAGYLSFFFSRMTQIVVISTLLDEKAYESVEEIAKNGYPVLVISPSPVEFGKRKERRDGRVERVAEDLVRLERDMKISALRRYATVIDWNVKEPLSHAIREANPQMVRAR
jgi:uncharacterized protein (DUF58 family)